MGAKELDVVVIGGICQDFTSYAPRFPKPGESVRGYGFVYGYGGNGNNQAVMATRLGATTALIGKVGGDMFGQALIDNMVKNGVNADYVGLAADANTATAAIMVDDSGQNKFAYTLGANLSVKTGDVKKAETAIANCKVVVCQLDVTEEAVIEALKIGKKHGASTIFSASPVPKQGVISDIYKYSDIICANEYEAHLLVGFPLNKDQDIDQALSVILKRGAKVVIITLGKKGCAFATSDDTKPIRVSAPAVKAVDATGAGDAFIGSLAYFTACHPSLSLEERIRRCCQLAAISVQSAGTQPSYPTRDQLPKGLLE